MTKFWNWIRDDEGERILRLEGPIDEQNTWGDGITPSAFRDELEAEEGDVTVWINSPGGSVFCGAEIYNMLCDYKGKVTVKIDAIAASAASVIAMAGDRVLISPVGMIVVHDPMTIAMGNTRDMEKAITTLNEVKESLINAYVKKSGLSRNKVAKLMSEETWLNARKAVEYGFADEILFEDEKKQPDEDDPDNNDPDEDDDNTDGDEKDGKKEKTIKSYSPVWQFSSKLMEETILNQLSGEDLNEGGEQDPTDPEAQEPAEERVTETTEPTDEVTLNVVESTDEEGETEEEAPDKIGEPIDVTGLLSAVDELLAAVDDLLTTVDVHHETVVDSAADMPQIITDIEEPETITIGFDGKTEDGSMPYTLLKKQLEYLR